MGGAHRKRISYKEKMMTNWLNNIQHGMQCGLNRRDTSMTRNLMVVCVGRKQHSPRVGTWNGVLQVATGPT
jgi:hypothetical protein